MNISTKADGTDDRSTNPILVGFFQEIRRLAEELTRREQATGHDTHLSARRFKLATSPPEATGSLFSY